MRVRALSREDLLVKGNGNPLQYSCLKIPTDRGAWQATVREAAESWDRTEVTEHKQDCQNQQARNAEIDS